MGGQLDNIGSVYRDIEKWDDSLDNYRNAQKIFKNAGYGEGIASQYGNIAYAYLMKGDLSPNWLSKAGNCANATYGLVSYVAKGLAIQSTDPIMKA